MSFRSRSFLLIGLLGPVGCTFSKDDSLAAQGSPLIVDSMPQVTLRSATCEGDLCPEGSALLDVADTAFTAVFSSAVAEGNDPTTKREVVIDAMGHTTLMPGARPYATS